MVANSELTRLVASGFSNTLDSFNEKAIIDRLNGSELLESKKFYSEQLEKFIRLLDGLKINYYLSNPITIKIIFDKFEQDKLNVARQNITSSNANYLEIIKKPNSNEIIIYLDNELANNQNEQLIKKL